MKAKNFLGLLVLVCMAWNTYGSSAIPFENSSLKWAFPISCEVQGENVDFGGTLSYSLFLRRFPVDQYITADNGCRFHLTGWVDVSFFPPSIDGYDINAEGDGDCGSFHFVGSSGKPGGTVPDGKLDEEWFLYQLKNIVNSGIR